MNLKKVLWLGMLMILALSISACNRILPSLGPDPTPSLVVPTNPAATETAGSQTPVVEPPTPTPQATSVSLPPTATLPAPPVSTIPPTAVPPTSIPPTAAPPTATPQVSVNQYQVAYVTADDTLNVRLGAGVDFMKLGELVPEEEGITLTGEEKMVDGSRWVVIESETVTGWVNSYYLTGQESEAAFCAQTAPMTAVIGLETALTSRDSEALTALIHPERGLRVRRHWWNPEVHFYDIDNLLTSSEVLNWGIEDGSGLPIEGNFAQVILPLLDLDYVGATDISCNEINHGGTAGLVQLPDGYQTTNYYALYRPATDVAGFDWGTWVVGVELWKGEYYISYLVHYGWEI